MLTEQNEYWAGLPFEEDVELAVEIATQMLGPQGRMLEMGRSVILNARLGTPRLGVIWYGDLNAETDIDRIVGLGLRVGEEISFLD